MEQTVWVFFSVIAVIIALGIIAGLLFHNSQRVGEQHFVRALADLKTQCDYVCDSSFDTNLPVRVTLPSGVYLFTKSQKICGNLEQESRCQMCKCEVMDYVLNLNTTIARRTFRAHDYNCYFKRLEDSVALDCQG